MRIYANDKTIVRFPAFTLLSAEAANQCKRVTVGMWCGFLRPHSTAILYGVFNSNTTTK